MSVEPSLLRTGMKELEEAVRYETKAYAQVLSISGVDLHSDNLHLRFRPGTGTRSFTLSLPATAGGHFVSGHGMAPVSLILPQFYMHYLSIRGRSCQRSDKRWCVLLSHLRFASHFEHTGTLAPKLARWHPST